MKIKDIAQWEDTDSELAKYTITILQQEIERLKDVIKNKHLKEIERLNNIIKRLETDLYNMYIAFGEFSEEYTEKKIREIKGESNEESNEEN